MEINFASKKKKSSKNNTSKRIETKITKHLPADAASDGVQVMVTEVSCTEPDCVPLETLIICIGMQARWADKVLKPIAEVTDSDIEEIAQEIPVNWTEWIQSEVERKRLKSAQDSDVDQSNQAIISSSSEIPVLQSPTPLSTTATTTTTTATTSTLITMRPRTDRTNPQGITTTKSFTSSSAINATTPSTDNFSNLPLPPPPTATATADNNIKRDPSIQVPISATESVVKTQKVKKPPTLKSRDETLPAARHSSKGVRQRGCPCCDPDNMDNMLDKMLYFDAPP